MKVKFDVTKLENGDVVATSVLYLCFYKQDDLSTNDAIEGYLVYSGDETVQKGGIGLDVYDEWKKALGAEPESGKWYSIYVDEETSKFILSECHHEHIIKKN